MPSQDAYLSVKIVLQREMSVKPDSHIHKCSNAVRYLHLVLHLGFYDPATGVIWALRAHWQKESEMCSQGWAQKVNRLCLTS